MTVPDTQIRAIFTSVPKFQASLILTPAATTASQGGRRIRQRLNANARYGCFVNDGVALFLMHDKWIN